MCGIGNGSQHSNISKGKKGGWGGGVHIKITGMQDSNSLKVDRNKNVTLNRCP